MTTYAIASGLGESFGFAPQVLYDTWTSSGMRWIMHNKAEFQLKKKIAQSQALHGDPWEQSNRRRLTTFTVDGSVEYEVQDRQFGLLFQHMTGAATDACAPVQISSSLAYLQTFVPVSNGLEGLFLSGQKGIPEVPGGAVDTFSHTGLKIIDWEFACQVDEIAKLALTMDGRNEVTNEALVSPTYLSGASAPNLLAFNDGSLTIGGTVSTTSGITSISGGAAPTGLIKSISLKCENKVKQDRYYLGSQFKDEPISNAFRPLTGEIEIEYANLTDFYDKFVSDDPTPLQVTFTSPVPIDTGYYGTVSFIIPAIRWEEGSPNASGPEVIMPKIPFTALEDEVGDPMYQIQYTSADTTT